MIHEFCRYNKLLRLMRVARIYRLLRLFRLFKIAKMHQMSSILDSKFVLTLKLNPSTTIMFYTYFRYGGNDTSYIYANIFCTLVWVLLVSAGQVHLF